MKHLTVILLVLIVRVMALGQDPLKVGDEVKYQCFCFGQEWVNATVLQVGGGNVRVRFGNMDNQVITLPIGSPKLRVPPKEFIATQLELAFAKEARPKYLRFVEQFAQAYNPEYTPQASGPLRPAEWDETMSALTAFDSECRTRWRGVRDWDYPYVRPGLIDYRFAQWCDLASRRNELAPKRRMSVVNSVVNLGYTTENLNFGFNEPDNPLRTEVQQMIWDREKWRAAKMAELKPRYAEYGVAVPPDATAAAEKRADELKVMVMRDAPNRSYKQPPWHDASVEGVVRSALAKEYPGVQVVKIGLDYKTWVKRKSLDYVASDDLFRYYKVSYNSYKRGTVLIKIPNRPFCQMQDFVVGLSGSKVVPAGIGGSGTFMRCE